MSDVMIGGGNSLGALLEGFTEEYGSMDEQEYGPAFVLPGLGFFPWGVVDQHFDRKARLGRLVVVNLAERARFPLGFGVDENTAMVVDPDQTFTVVGQGGVTVVDVADAKVDGEGDERAIRDVRLHFLAAGDRYDLKTGKVVVLPDKYTTRGYEYFNVPGSDVTGSFSSNARIRNAVTFGLVDNAAVDSLRTYCFDGRGRGFEILFRKIDETEGYWGYLDGLVDSYSATDVMMDVLPVRVLIVPR